MTKSKNFWNSLLSTLWFVPMFLGACGILLGFVFTGLDYFFDAKLRFLSSFLAVQASAAREILGVIAGSTITVTGTVFSITIVALTLASTQFSPRILRNFMRDAGNQIVLGTLVGIVAYCIVVLRMIRDSAGTENFAPTVAVFFGVIFGFVGIGCLVYFIHHVATSIQATSIIALIAGETVREIKRTYPETEPEISLDKESLEIFANPRGQTIPANATGYIQNADVQKLVSLADESDLILKMRRRIGQFSVEGLPLLQIVSAPAGFSLDENLIENFQEIYDIGVYRTVEGDVAFGLRQIVDIALKALSPAVNDTTTAVICIDYLSAILSCLAKRPSCPSYIYSGGKLRLMIEQQRFEDFFDLAFNQIRQNAGGNVAVILRQLNSINILSKINVHLNCEDERRERHDLMQTQARLLYELARRSIAADVDLQAVVRYYRAVEKSLEERGKDLSSPANFDTPEKQTARAPTKMQKSNG